MRGWLEQNVHAAAHKQRCSLQHRDSEDTCISRLSAYFYVQLQGHYILRINVKERRKQQQLSRELLGALCFCVTNTLSCFPALDPEIVLWLLCTKPHRKQSYPLLQTPGNNVGDERRCGTQVPVASFLPLPQLSELAFSFVSGKLRELQKRSNNTLKILASKYYVPV